MTRRSNRWEIDISPLGKCKELRWLYISDNRLKKLDLSPLRELTKLQYLVLSGNLLREIDLSPLERSSDLRYLHLNENIFQKLDISVLFHSENLESLVLDDTVTLVANHKLKHLHYFPDPINEKLETVQWSHEATESSTLT